MNSLSNFVPLLAKLFSALLAISGVILAFLGIASFVTAEPNSPMFFAMLLAISAFGLGCIVAAVGIFRMRPYGFAICAGLGICVAMFALFVHEAVGQGILWPIFTVMTTCGTAGLIVKPGVQSTLA